jgi:hypothetical protein
VDVPHFLAIRGISHCPQMTIFNWLSGFNISMANSELVRFFSIRIRNSTESANVNKGNNDCQQATQTEGLKTNHIGTNQCKTELNIEHGHLLSLAKILSAFEINSIASVVWGKVIHPTPFFARG